MAISPISSNNTRVPAQTAPVPSKKETTPAASTSSASVESPLKEKSETRFQEANESPAQKNAEAMRSLASQENAQVQSAALNKIVSTQIAINAYQTSK